MKIGFNTVLFGGLDVERAFEAAAFCGYNGVELSAIPGMAEHLDVSRWQEQAPALKEAAQRHGLELLAIEQPAQDPGRMAATFAAAAALGIPVVNCGPGGTSGDEESLAASIESLRTLAGMAADHGVVLCVKAHVGQAMFDTPTTLRVLDAIDSPSFALDMDPSHIHRANEDSVEALSSVVKRMGHVHIRDCKGRQQGPGIAEAQANGRGDIDLLGFIKVLHDNGYEGAVDLEIIGAGEYSLERRYAIAAEARGHMQASLQACGAR
ncbi:MAG: sugar phosphate isomerase/epimerase family protein [Candidatus Dormibacteria bacterium]